MTAIDLTRLQKQIEELSSVFSEPAAFVKALHELLSFYERRAYRPSSELVSTHSDQCPEMYSARKIMDHLFHFPMEG